MKNFKKRLKIIKILFTIILFFMLSYSALGEWVVIKNLGHVGFNETNQSYTPFQTVILELNYSTNANNCRYANNETTVSWSAWEACNLQKYWLLTADEGIKTVLYEINHSVGGITNFSDDIILSYEGYGLDITPPEQVIITFF